MSRFSGLLSTRKKIFFELDAHDWHGFSSESLWARISRIGGWAKLENAPFFAKGVSNADAIDVELRDGLLWFRRVREKSGHATLRLRVRKFSANRDRVMGELHALTRLGCSFEGAELGEAQLFAVDIPIEVAAEDIVSAVTSGAEADLWDAEMGDTGGRAGFWNF